jgi:hypothetical protein
MLGGARFKATTVHPPQNLSPAPLGNQGCLRRSQRALPHCELLSVAGTAGRTDYAAHGPHADSGDQKSARVVDWITSRPSIHVP